MYLYHPSEPDPAPSTLGQPPVYPDSRPHPAFDAWTPVHVAAGFLLGACGVPPGIALSLALGWELVEAETNIRPAFFNSKRPEGAANVAVDVLSFTAGLVVGEAIRGRGPARAGSPVRPA